MSARRAAIYFSWVVSMAFFFANCEIQIEGPAGWAANLPTWRIESHWLLDIFWGGRAMTGYHAWVFSFMALVFFSPLFFNGRFSLVEALQALAGLMVFWMAEDFLWFVCNPAYGWAHFDRAHVAWHPHWWLGAPVDYWEGLVGVVLVMWLRTRLSRRGERDGERMTSRA